MIADIVCGYIIQKGLIAVYQENPELLTSIYQIVKDYMRGYTYEVIEDDESYQVEKGFILLE